MGAKTILFDNKILSALIITIFVSIILILPQNVFGTTTNTGLAAIGPPVIDGNLMAFRVSEAGQGVNLNGDADMTDFVVHVFDASLPVSATNPTNTGLAVSGAVAIPVIDGNLVAFPVSEADQSAILNGDADMTDAVVHVFLLVTTVPLTEDIEDLVNSGDLAEKDGEKITKSLDKATKALTEDTVKANEKLDKFVTEVNKLSDQGKISDDDKEKLIDAVDAIQDDGSITVDEIETVKDALDMVTLDDKDRNKLTKLLDGGIKELTPDTGKACKELNKSIKDTQKLIDQGKLDATDGQTLINSANAVKASIPC